MGFSFSSLTSFCPFLFSSACLITFLSCCPTPECRITRPLWHTGREHESPHRVWGSTASPGQAPQPDHNLGHAPGTFATSRWRPGSALRLPPARFLGWRLPCRPRSNFLAIRGHAVFVLPPMQYHLGEEGGANPRSSCLESAVGEVPFREDSGLCLTGNEWSAYL